jgi:GDP-4-dehydro-6-deoxy-D-mannose reductase
MSGSGGFVGQHLMVRLSDSSQFDVRTLGRANGDVAAAETWSKCDKADVVVHLAARTFVPESWEDPAAFVSVNVTGTVNALEYCKRHGARMVHVSSYLYGVPRVLPINEQEPTRASNPYMLSKLMAEQACEFYARACGVPVSILRPFNIYGVGQDEKFLIPTILKQVARSSSVAVNDLTPRRDYVNVADLAEAIVSAIAHPAALLVCNVASGKSHSVLDVIELAQKLTGRKVEIIDRGVRRQGEIMDTIADVSLARDALKWAPKIDLEHGLSMILETMK